jgi:hypothetical protein
MAEQEFGKLHIDSDWKSEAAKEKERLAEQEKKEPVGRMSPLGPPSILEIVDLIVMQVAVALGGYQGIQPNPAAAKHYIDLLEVFEQKTRGNLSDEEKQMLNAILHEIRMQFVQAAGRMVPATEPPVE